MLGINLRRILTQLWLVVCQLVMVWLCILGTRIC